MMLQKNLMTTNFGNLWLLKDLTMLLGMTQLLLITTLMIFAIEDIQRNIHLNMGVIPIKLEQVYFQ